MNVSRVLLGFEIWKLNNLHSSSDSFRSCGQNIALCLDFQQ
jgi:hypothetical protein